MDPNACLKRIDDAKRPDSRECREAIADLERWIAGGGFAPNWQFFPRGTRRFSRKAG